MQIDTAIDSSKLTLCNPNGVQGGSYMTKIKYHDIEGFRFQTPKLLLKQGIVLTDKKGYMDLLIDSSNSELISWIESLETCIQQKI